MPLFRTKPNLTRQRIWAAYSTAVLADGLQLLLMPFAWTFLDDVIDIVAMALLTITLGFHPLFLPTFIVEVIPGIEMFPTWTACVAVVVAARRREQRAPVQGGPSRDGSRADVIDV
jgi:hypothetical protein